MGTFGGITYQISEMAGTESVTLTTQQIPIHTHPHGCSDGNQAANSADPTNGVANKSDLSQFNSAGYDNVSQMGTPPLSSDPTGGSQPHENCQPFLCINYIISLFGLFPSPT
jgi:microcystin-dependent protein